MDGVAAYLNRIGWGCVDVDICNAKLQDTPCDLSDDALWEQIFSQIRGGEFDAVLIGTPLDLSVAARARRHEGYAQPQNHGRSSRAP